MTLAVSATKVKPGEQVSVEWAAPSSTSVYLLGEGRVAATGRKEMSLRSKANFVLVAETPDGPIIRNAEVAMSGVRGDDDEFEPNLGSFRYPYSQKLKAYDDYGAMLDSIVTSIQSKLDAVQRRIEIDSSSVKVETNRLAPSDLQTNLPGYMFGRRVSWLLEAPGSNGFKKGVPADVTIKSLIEFRRRVEPKWYAEQDETLYHSQALKLAKLLG